MQPERAAKMLTTPGTPFSSCSWQYGWPDRLLLSGDTLMAIHLLALDDFELDVFADLTGPLLGVRYGRDADGALSYGAVRRGFRTSGVVGTPHHPTVARPPDGWWR